MQRQQAARRPCGTLFKVVRGPTPDILQFINDPSLRQGSLTMTTGDPDKLKTAPRSLHALDSIMHYW